MPRIPWDSACGCYGLQLEDGTETVYTCVDCMIEDDRRSARRMLDEGRLSWYDYRRLVDESKGFAVPVCPCLEPA